MLNKKRTEKNKKKTKEKKKKKKRKTLKNEKKFLARNIAASKKISFFDLC